MAQTAAQNCFAGKLDASRFASTQTGRCFLALAKGGTRAAFDKCLAKATSDTSGLVASVDAAAAVQGFACPGTMATLRLDARTGWFGTLLAADVVGANALPSTCVARHT
ncbi:MAG TPA: hypothetical protein VEB21_05785, partial [Terriglobales bacterium]|nr:hypothetical protein [Terriglobales bacterium]